MTDRKKLVMVASIDTTQLNGPAIHLCSLVRHFVGNGYDVTLIIPAHEGRPALPLPSEHLHVVRTRRLKTGPIPNSLGVFTQLPALWRYRKRGVLHIRSAPLSFILTAAARLFRYKRIILEINGWLADEVDTLGFPSIVGKIMARTQLVEAGLADAVRVVSPGLEAIFRQARDDVPIALIENGTDLSIYQPLDRRSCRERLGLSAKGKYLAFSGNLVPWQDLPTVFAAMAALEVEGERVELLIAGAGPALEMFKSAARQSCGLDRVHFFGPLPPQEVNVILNAADVAVAPFTSGRNTHTGISPLKIRDYAAAGCITVSNSLPGMERLENEPWISLVPCQDASALAAALSERLHLADDEADAMRNAAREYAKRHFDWREVVRQLDQLITGD